MSFLIGPDTYALKYDKWYIMFIPEDGDSEILFSGNWKEVSVEAKEIWGQDLGSEPQTSNRRPSVSGPLAREAGTRKKAELAARVEEFYNKCHDEKGRFCETDGGEGSEAARRRAENDSSEGLNWSLAQPMTEKNKQKYPGAGPGEKVDRWFAQNKRQEAALNRLKAEPSVGDKGKDNKDWIRSKGEVDESIKTTYDEELAKRLIKEHPENYPTTKIKLSSIIGSEHYVRRNPLAEVIHMVDQPKGPYARPGYYPVVVKGKNGKYLLVDGNHRVQGASYLLEKDIEVRIMDPNEIRRR